MPEYINKTLNERYAKIFKSSGVSKVSFIYYLYWQEQAAKFIVNSLRVYKFYGYATRIPFWDIRLIIFWSGMELELKKSRESLFDIEKECLLMQQVGEIPYNSNKDSHGETKEKH